MESGDLFLILRLSEVQKRKKALQNLSHMIKNYQKLIVPKILELFFFLIIFFLVIITFGTEILGNIISFLGETLCRGLVKAFLGILQSYNFYGCTLGGLKIDFGVRR